MYALTSRQRNQGMTLIEVLIAIVIFAIGLLGIAALQVAGLRYTKGSQSRVTAAMYAENMADRMRSNSDGVAAGNYVNPGALTVNCDAAVCTPAQLAAFDTARWLSAIRDSLGANATDATVNGTVCVDSTPDDGTFGAWACDNTGNVFAIKIEWLERRVERNTRDAAEVSDAYGTDSAVAGFSSNRFVLRVMP
jgi:type IV pilus assembly protein PilV